MKICYTCKIEKDENLFNKNKAKKDGLQSKCRECDQKRAKEYFHTNKDFLMVGISKRKKERMIRNRKFIVAFLETHPCVDCNNSDIRVLEFDHVIGNKLANVGSLASGGYKLETLKKEIEKCVVRCANCHRIKTAQQFNHYGYLAEID